LKFLLIQLRRIGDVLMATPSIRLIRESFPEAKLTFLTENPSNQVLEGNKFLDEIILFNKSKSIFHTISFLQKIRKKKYDCVIDFFGNPRSSFITAFSGSPIRIGFRFRGRRWAYSHPVNIKGELTYAAQDKIKLLEPLGIFSNNYSLDFFESEKDKDYAKNLFKNLGIKDKDFVVSLSPVSRQPYKVWPSERFAKIADWLIKEYNAKILFLFGPGEKHFVDAVKSKMSQKALPDYDIPTLSETLSILHRVNLHFGNDNGPRHFAIAAGIPSLAIFGRPWAVNWTPPQTTKHYSIEFDPGCKNNCFYPKCKLECLEGVTVESVENELVKIIKTFR